MKEINIDFLGNFKKNRIDEKFLEFKEGNLGVKFGRKYKEFLIKYYRDIDIFKVYESKYLPSKLITSLGFGIPRRDNQNFIDMTNMIISGSISIKNDSTENNYYIAIGLENSGIEDEIFLVKNGIAAKYICKDINEFIDSIHDENGNKLEFNNDKYSSDQLNEEDILKAEEEIGLKFPDSYKKFLLETGGGTLEGPLIIDNKTGSEIEYDFKNPDRPIFYNRYAPSHEMNKNDHIILNFSLADTLNYWDILRGETDGIEYNFKAICEKQIIPIGLNGDTGVFFIGAKGSENEGKIFFYDYVLYDDEPESIEFICDSFEEYNNSFYWRIPEGVDYSLKSNVKYI